MGLKKNYLAIRSISLFSLLFFFFSALPSVLPYAVVSPIHQDLTVSEQVVEIDLPRCTAEGLKQRRAIGPGASDVTFDVTVQSVFASEVDLMLRRRSFWDSVR